MHGTESAFDVQCVHVGASGNERLHHFVASIGRGVMQHGHSVLVGRIYIDSSIGQRLHRFDVSPFRSLEELLLISCHLDLGLHVHSLSPGAGAAAALQQVAPSLDRSLSSHTRRSRLVTAHGTGASRSGGWDECISLLLGASLLASEEVSVTDGAFESARQGQEAAAMSLVGSCVAVTHTFIDSYLLLILYNAKVTESLLLSRRPVPQLILCLLRIRQCYNTSVLNFLFYAKLIIIRKAIISRIS